MSIVPDSFFLYSEMSLFGGTMLELMIDAQGVIFEKFIARN